MNGSIPHVIRTRRRLSLRVTTQQEGRTVPDGCWAMGWKNPARPASAAAAQPAVAASICEVQRSSCIVEQGEPADEVRQATHRCPVVPSRSSTLRSKRYWSATKWLMIRDSPDRSRGSLRSRHCVRSRRRVTHLVARSPG